MSEKDQRHEVVRVESALGRPHGGDAYANHLRSIQEQGECPFCPERLIHEHKRPILHETDLWILTENMYPAKNSNHHLLAIHRAHIEHMKDLSDDAWGDLRKIMMGEAVLRHIRGGTFVMRWGEGKYNASSVSHLHAHLIAGSGNNDLPVITRVG